MVQFTSHVKKLPWRSAVVPGVFLLVLFGVSAYQDGIHAALRDASLPVMNSAAPHVSKAFAVAFWLGWAWFINGMLAVFLWEGVARHFAADSVPRFFRNTVSVVIYMLAAAGIFSLVFGLDLTGLWATSGVLGLVLGFALKSLIADFFSGVALSLDPPFKLGDWVKLELGGGPIYGQVIEMHWRQTKIQNRGRTKTFSVPHSLLTSAAVTTLYQPAGRLRFDLNISLNQVLGVDRALRILESAMFSAPLILQDPRPQVFMNGNDIAGLVFTLRYWIRSDISMDRVAHAVWYSVFTTMERSNVLLACAKHDIFTAGQVPDVWNPKGGRATFISQTPVFQALDENEVNELADRTLVRSVKAGQPVITAGEPGHSMYIIREGTLDVMLGAGPADSKVAHLKSGNFFGEMSLLTGDPRSATVVAVSDAVLYEIDKEALHPVLARNPHVAEEICRIVELRRLENVDLIDSQAAAAAAATGGLGSQLLARVKKFFAL